MNSIQNKKTNSAVGEAGAEVDAVLGLQRSSTNPPLQTAPEESQVLTVSAGPGSSGSGTNVVPQQIAMEEDANQQVTAGTSSDRKRLTGSQKRKLRRQALRANEAACSTAALQSPVASTVAPKRRKDSKDTPPQGMRSPKRPKPARLPTTNTELAGVGLSSAQRTNPLTVIVADTGYPESVLSPEQFELFREATLQALDKEPASNWPRFETSFCRGGVFIFVASNPEAKAWLTKTVAELRPWEGANLKVGGVEILQRMLKATAWIPGKPSWPDCL